jgi:hypothetical protein
MHGLIKDRDHLLMFALALLSPMLLLTITSWKIFPHQEDWKIAAIIINCILSMPFTLSFVGVLLKTAAISKEKKRYCSSCGKNH